MLTNRKIISFATGCALALVGATAALAAPDHDNPAGLVIFPKIVVDSANGIDTRLHLSNASSAPDGQTSSDQMAHCFYVNANSHCTNTGGVCSSFQDCEQDGIYGACVPGWIETNFDIYFTQRQPIGWVASEGLAGDDLPCRATFLNPNPCSGMGSNSGTRIPPISEDPFIGELKCIQADSTTRLPRACASADECRNDLTGHAALTSSSLTDVASYRAAGLENVRSNADTSLVVGGDPGSNAEYEPCADILVMDFVYDGATDPIAGAGLQAASELTLVPCTQDFRGQDIEPVTAQFLVFNEFEQRLSTSRRVDCLLDTPISRIDTSQPQFSIFSVNVGQTITGQARIRGVGGGLAGVAVLGLATDFTDPSTLQGWAGYALDTAAETPDDAPDIISLP
jgi:hypothetical protein